jgi:hypothetical protein
MCAKSTLWLLLFGLIVPSVQAATISSTSKLAWDYDAADQANIDGFKLYIDDKVQSIVILPVARSISAGTLTPGKHNFELTAYNAAQESVRSNKVEAVYVNSAPVPPATLRIVFTITATVP